MNFAAFFCGHLRIGGDGSMASRSLIGGGALWPGVAVFVAATIGSAYH